MGERKEDIHKVRDLREHLERLRRELEEAEGNYDLNRAAELRHGKIPAIEKELKEAEEMGANNKQENRLLREEVSEEETLRLFHAGLVFLSQNSLKVNVRNYYA